MRRKAITLSKDDAIIPTFHSVAVTEYADHIRLTPTYWCREFVGLGRCPTSTVASAGTKPKEQIHPDFYEAMGKEIWVICWWERYEDGREKPLQLQCISGTTSEREVRATFQQLINFTNMTKKELEAIGKLFHPSADDIAYIRNRFPEGCPDPQSIEEYDLYLARLKVLAGLQPKTVALIEQANTTEPAGEREACEHEAVAAYFAELARHWTDEQVQNWQRSNPIGTKWMCEYARVIKSPGKRLDPVNHSLVLDWLRKKLNLLTAEELAASIFKATGYRVSAATIKKRRERLGLTTERTPGPRPNVEL